MIIDIVLIILVVLALIYGLYKGFAGVLFGFVGTLIIAVALSVGLTFLEPTIMFKDPSVGASVVETENGKTVEGYTGLFMSLYESMSKSFDDSDDELMNAELIMKDDILQLKIMNEDGTYKTVKFSVALMEFAPFFSPAHKGDDDSGTENLAQLLDEQEGENEGVEVLDKFITQFGVEGLTVKHAFIAFATLSVLSSIIWIVSFIVLVIVKIIIRRLIFRALDRHSVASKIDRTIGAIVAVAVVVCVIWLVLSVVGLFSEVESFQTTLEQNPICNFFAEHSMFGSNSNNNPPVDGDQDLIARSVAHFLKN